MATRVTMISTAALFTTLIAVNHDALPGGEPTPNHLSTPSGTSGGLFALPPPASSTPDIPDSVESRTRAEDEKAAVDPVPETPPVAAAPRTSSTEPVDTAKPQPDHHRTLTATLISGILHGWGWLAHALEYLIAHMMSAIESREV
ncbi:hypothetical protein [Nocardia altamirensis]|uniref:hypothetical protein n=1 Tax=Nocardia altamirensis TaxID=472158 RepID=UPI0008404BBE|nr:hypothetical protein [Nocardia altamirensis]